MLREEPGPTARDLELSLQLEGRAFGAPLVSPATSGAPPLGLQHRERLESAIPVHDVAEAAAEPLTRTIGEGSDSYLAQFVYFVVWFANESTQSNFYT